MFKREVTKKIINLKVRNIRNYGGFMNNYKFKDDILGKTEEVTQNFIIDEKLNNFYEILDEMKGNGFVFIRHEMPLIEGKEINNVMDKNFINKDTDSYFDYPKIFGNDELDTIRTNLLKLFEIISSIEFEKQLILKRKDNYLKEYDISAAVRINDKIFTLNKKLAEIKHKINDIQFDIKEREQQFIDDYNHLLIDIREAKIEKDETLEILYSIYTKVVVDEYKINLAIYFADKIFIDMDKKDVINILSGSERIKEYLGYNYSEFIDRLGYVGENC